MRVGCFIKTPAPHVAELLGLAGMDFGVVDAEHGPFDRGGADLMMIGGRAASLPLYVRIGDRSAAGILWALDIGAAGLIIPHIEDGGEAATVVKLARFRNGTRGISSSGRFADYGTIALAEAIERGETPEIFCQIESGGAVRQAESIARTPGIAGLVVGRADLALSLGETRVDAPSVLTATQETIEVARAADKEAVIVTASAVEAAQFVEFGATMVIVGSDQAFMRMGATAAAEALRALEENKA